MTIRHLGLIVSLAGTGLVLAHPDAIGAWRGAIAPGSIDLEIRVTIGVDATGDGLVGTIDIPAQGFVGQPLVNVVQKGDAISFAVPGIPGDPIFDGVIDGERLSGTFSQGGQALEFALERDAEPAALRPQEPLPPFPYDEEEVAFASGEVTLAGTLTLPPDEHVVPGLLLITGSGAQDRNEEILGHKPFLVIADHLTRAGFAVLRVDDRGVGGSTGSDADATFDDLVGDALAGVELLRAHPRVDGDRVGLLGHSQGGYLAPVAALEADSGVAFVILMAGPALDGFSVLVAQNERIFDLALRQADPEVSDEVVTETIAGQIAFLEALNAALQGDDVAAARALVRERVEAEMAVMPADQRLAGDELEAFLALQKEAVTSPVFRSFLAFDPQPYLRRLTVPTLAFFGSLDLQVPPEQSEGPMREALDAAGNPDATVITFEGLNHLMQPAVTGGVDEYGAIETTVDPAVLETIARWLQERFLTR